MQTNFVAPTAAAAAAAPAPEHDPAGPYGGGVSGAVTPIPDTIPVAEWSDIGRITADRSRVDPRVQPSNFSLADRLAIVQGAICPLAPADQQWLLAQLTTAAQADGDIDLEEALVLLSDRVPASDTPDAGPLRVGEVA